MGGIVNSITGKGTSPPPSPDYGAAAQQQGGANLQAALASAVLNRPTEVTPYGTRSWQQTGTTRMDNLTGVPAFDVPNYTSSIQFTPQGQQLFDRENQMKLGLADVGNQAIGTVQNVMGTPFRFDGPGVQTSLDTSGIAKMPINAGTTALQAGMARLEPTLARQRTSMETQLTNQGLRPGTEAWTTAARDQSMRENDLMNAMVRDSLGLDMSANQQGYNQALQSGQFGNQAQQQQLQQALYQRNLPLNEVMALMSGSQVQAPNFQQYGQQQVQPTPVFGGAQAEGQYGMNAYSNQVAQNNAMLSGLAQLGGSALMANGLAGGAGAGASLASLGTMFSDRRLKRNIERVGTHPLGIGIYEYDIFGDRARGVMADEVLTVRPEAVLQHPSGYLMVDYAAL